MFQPISGSTQDLPLINNSVLIDVFSILIFSIDWGTSQVSSKSSSVIVFVALLINSSSAINNP